MALHIKERRDSGTLRPKFQVITFSLLIISLLFITFSFYWRLKSHAFAVFWHLEQLCRLLPHRIPRSVKYDIQLSFSSEMFEKMFNANNVRAWYIVIKESEDIKWLEINNDRTISFRKRKVNICCTSNYKPHALKNIRKSFTREKAKLIGNAVIENQFNYISVK